jgi:membrane protein DedA with SNARE-associated domain
MLNSIYPYVIVFITGMAGIWKAVPVGVAFQLNAVETWISTSAGASVAVFILYFFGKKIRDAIMRKLQKKKNSKKEARASKLLEQYGVAGLGFIGTLLMGPNMTLIIGLIITKSHKKLFYWTLIGIAVWSLALSLLAGASLELFQKLTANI